MKRAILTALCCALSACELGMPGEPTEESIGILVVDAAPALTSGEDVLFQVRYCSKDSGPSYLVSELRTDLEAQGMHWKAGYNFRYELTTDVNRDHRFGPGDVLTVSEKEWEELGPSDVGMTYKVSLFHTEAEASFSEGLLGAADWQAR